MLDDAVDVPAAQQDFARADAFHGPAWIGAGKNLHRGLVARGIEQRHNDGAVADVVIDLGAGERCPGLSRFRTFDRIDAARLFGGHEQRSRMMQFDDFERPTLSVSAPGQPLEHIPATRI